MSVRLSKYLVKAFLAFSEMNTMRILSPLPLMLNSWRSRLIWLRLREEISDTRRPAENNSSKIARSRKDLISEPLALSKRRDISSGCKNSTSLEGFLPTSIFSADNECTSRLAKYLRKLRKAMM